MHRADGNSRGPDVLQQRVGQLAAGELLREVEDRPLDERQPRLVAVEREHQASRRIFLRADAVVRAFDQRAHLPAPFDDRRAADVEAGELREAARGADGIRVQHDDARRRRTSAYAVGRLRSVSLTGSQPRGEPAPGLPAENGAGIGAASMCDCAPRRSETIATHAPGSRQRAHASRGGEQEAACRHERVRFDSAGAIESIVPAMILWRRRAARIIDAPIHRCSSNPTMTLDRVPAGKDVPNDCNVIIEIPMRGDPIKYEVDKETGAVFVDRFMSTAMHYPCNYGYIPRTLSDDGDPCDVLVLSPMPLITGVVVRCRPIGMLKMDDEAGGDSKILAVPVDKLTGLYRDVQSPRDLPEITTQQIAHFFEHYKDLEPGKWVRVSTWVGAEEAKREILDGVARYEAAHRRARTT